MPKVLDFGKLATEMNSNQASDIFVDVLDFDNNINVRELGVEANIMASLGTAPKSRENACLRLILRRD